MTDFYETEWGTFNQPGLEELCRVRRLTGETYRVLFALISQMDKGNEIKVRPMEIGLHLGIRPAEVSRQIRLLTECGILSQRRICGWVLNPHYLFKGDPDKDLRRRPNGQVVLSAYPDAFDGRAE